MTIKKKKKKIKYKSESDMNVNYCVTHTRKWSSAYNPSRLVHTH